MFGIGTWELIVILVLGLIILGPSKFPEVAKSLGKGLANLRRSVDEVKEDIDLDSLKSEIEEEVGLDELKRSLDVRGDVRRAISELDDPYDLPEADSQTSAESESTESKEVTEIESPDSDQKPSDDGRGTKSV
ncbi:MAG: twin-arginine translocase TatA/TatE family subunit [Deltaproteobacteria bacterium]|nr:twin-arginine translocase TatA/TatE family subunit [Deltaproteobacteria bacterium]MBW1873169.1 twin-arginine translocase TatA/TatE family subunit [Deltaproteobacteria bacterium]